MKITLTKELKVVLLNALKEGILDTNKLPTEMSPLQINVLDEATIDEIRKLSD